MNRKFQDVKGGVKFITNTSLNDSYVPVYVKINLRDVGTDILELKANAIKLSSGTLCRISPDELVCEIVF